MPAIIVAFSGFCRTVQPLLHRGLTKGFIVLQTDDGLFADIGQVAIVAGERLDASTLQPTAK